MMSPVDLDKAIDSLRLRVREIDLLIERLQREQTPAAKSGKKPRKAEMN